MAKKAAKKSAGAKRGGNGTGGGGGGGGKGAAVAKPTKITASGKARSKGEIYRIVSEHTGVHRREVTEIFDVLGRIIEADLSKNGPGVVNIGGLMKVSAVRKPAQPARKGVPNPFKPGEMMDVAAKPARTVVKVRPLKSLKDMV